MPVTIHKNRAQLQASTGRYLRSTSVDELSALVAAGAAFWITRKNGVHVGQLREIRRSGDYAIASNSSASRPLDSTSISFSEMSANADPKSRRPGDREWDEHTYCRRRRIGNFVDRAMTKIEAWPSVGDTRAVRVGPRA